jgi:hypothetical protein
MTLSTAQWLASFAAEVGAIPPTEEETELLLDLAGTAAHAAERPAAPLTCWLVARAGLEPAAALAVARRLADKIAAEQD